MCCPPAYAEAAMPGIGRGRGRHLYCRSLVKWNSRNLLRGRNTPFSGRLEGIPQMSLASALASKSAVPLAAVSWIVTGAIVQMLNANASPVGKQVRDIYAAMRPNKMPEVRQMPRNEETRMTWRQWLERAIDWRSGMGASARVQDELPRHCQVAGVRVISMSPCLAIAGWAAGRLRPSC